MNRLGLALVAVLSVSAVVAAQAITLDTAPAFTFTNVAAAGSTAQTITPNIYLFSVSSDEGVFCCEARGSTATCNGAGGNYYPPGTQLLRRIRTSVSVSCRSAGANGDVYFTIAGQ